LKHLHRYVFWQKKFQPLSLNPPLYKEGGQNIPPYKRIFAPKRITPPTCLRGTSNISQKGGDPPKKGAFIFAWAKIIENCFKKIYSPPLKI